jgi:CheY-like chemotaxis protein
MLAGWKMKCTTVSPRSALATLAGGRQTGDPFRIVLIDSPLGEMDSFALAEQVQNGARPAPATVLLLRSLNLGRDAMRCRELNLGGFLTKPIRPSAMCATLIGLLGAPAAAASVAVTRAAAPSGTYRRLLHLLLAEDNIVNQTHVARVLQKRGHSVEIANNGKEALAALERGEFDLMLMDVQMPDMDGFEVTAAVRRNEAITGSHLPIIALTAHAVKGYREKCLAAGMDGYVTKPIRTQELLAVIDDLAPQRSGSAYSVERGPSTDGSGEADLNETNILARVDGDRELLKELVNLYLQDGPKLRSELREAVARRDPKRLQRAAHTLKGVVDLFQAKTAHTAATRLETVARSGDLSQADEALQTLERELARLQPALAELAR